MHRETWRQAEKPRDHTGMHTLGPPSAKHNLSVHSSHPPNISLPPSSKSLPLLQIPPAPIPNPSLPLLFQTPPSHSYSKPLPPTPIPNPSLPLLFQTPPSHSYSKPLPPTPIPNPSLPLLFQTPPSHSYSKPLPPTPIPNPSLPLLFQTPPSHSYSKSLPPTPIPNPSLPLIFQTPPSHSYSKSLPPTPIPNPSLPLLFQIPPSHSYSKSLFQILPSLLLPSSLPAHSFHPLPFPPSFSFLSATDMRATTSSKLPLGGQFNLTLRC